MQRIALELSCGANVQRLNNAGIDCRNDVHGSVQLCLRDTGFPCVRKAPLHSWIAKAHHRDGKAHEHFFTLGEALDGMRVLIEGSKVGFLDRHDSSLHCYQFQVSGVTFSSNQSRAELERVSGAQRVRLNQSLGVTAD